MLCPKCHYNNQAGAQFCSQCGSRLSAAPKAWPEASTVTQAVGQGQQPDGRKGPEEVASRTDRLRSAYAPPEGGNFYRSLEEQDHYQPANDQNTDYQQGGNPYVDYRPVVSAPDVNRPNVYDRNYTDDFSGDRYGGADAYYEEPDFDKDYYDYESSYRSQVNKGRTGQIILTVALGIVAVAVVVGIIFVVKNLVSDPPLQQQESATTPSTAMTTRPTEPSTKLTLPSATPTTTPATIPSTTPASSQPSGLATDPVAAIGGVQLRENYVIRSGPGTSHDRLGVVSGGTNIRVINEVQGEMVDGIGSTWYEVEYNGRTAYMIKDPSGQTAQPN